MKRTTLIILLTCLGWPLLAGLLRLALGVSLAGCLTLSGLILTNIILCLWIALDAEEKARAFFAQLDESGNEPRPQDNGSCVAGAATQPNTIDSTPPADSLSAGVMWFDYPDPL